MRRVSPHPVWGTECRPPHQSPGPSGRAQFWSPAGWVPILPRHPGASPAHFSSLRVCVLRGKGREVVKRKRSTPRSQQPAGQMKGNCHPPQAPSSLILVPGGGQAGSDLQGDFSSRAWEMGVACTRGQSSAFAKSQSLFLGMNTTSPKHQCPPTPVSPLSEVPWKPVPLRGADPPGSPVRRS